jgi:hypothetical protein
MLKAEVGAVPFLLELRDVASVTVEKQNLGSQVLAHSVQVECVQEVFVDVELLALAFKHFEDLLVHDMRRELLGLAHRHGPELFVDLLLFD